MIRLQDRDLEIMKDIGICQIMTYSQIRRLHFPSYQSCIKRISALQRDKLIKGAYYNTNEKVFVLTKDGVKVLNDLFQKEYKIGEYGNIYHKIMRSEFYCNVKDYGISSWINEAKVEELDRVFDMSFEYKERLYLVEVHNEQKTKVLKDRIRDCNALEIPFTLIIYCKNINPVNEMIDKMNEKGFKNVRKFGLKIFQLGDKIEL